MDTRSEASTAIEHAKRDLDDALAQLAKLPTVDADQIHYVAHALNNYLMVVMTISQVLRLEVDERASPEIGDRLTALNEATQKMKAAVQQLTTPSDTRQPKLVFAPVDLSWVARIASNTYQPIAALKGIVIKREIPEPAVTVWTDRIALGAVIDNLLSNAVKYSKPRGSITVRASQMEKEGIFAVLDCGPGIRAEEASRLFSRGERLSARPTGGESSTGYGLAIAKDLTDAVGGRLWWRNEAGGATFSLALPLYDPARHPVGA